MINTDFAHPEVADRINEIANIIAENVLKDVSQSDDFGWRLENQIDEYLLMREDSSFIVERIIAQMLEKMYAHIGSISLPLSNQYVVNRFSFSVRNNYSFRSAITFSLDWKIFIANTERITIPEIVDISTSMPMLPKSINQHEWACGHCGTPNTFEEQACSACGGVRTMLVQEYMRSLE